MKKFLILFFIALPITLHAATVSVGVKAGSEAINAVEGTLVLPQGVGVNSISTGGSTVLIWVTEPSFNSAEGSVSFAGVIPGGFSGTRPLFTLDLSSGSEAYAGGKLTGYRNDGAGTPIVLEYSFSSPEGSEDHEWPEPFTPVISSSPDLFDGERFVSFLAQDKGTGIDHYEYASSWILGPGSGEWKLVSSPLQLSRTELFKKIYIRAYDGATYYREASIAGPYHYATLVFGTIIILCVLFFVRRSFFS